MPEVFRKIGFPYGFLKLAGLERRVHWPGGTHVFIRGKLAQLARNLVETRSLVC